jgi:hypothetical protein
MGQYQQLFYNEELSKKIAKEAIHACASSLRVHLG